MIREKQSWNPTLPLTSITGAFSKSVPPLTRIDASYPAFTDSSNMQNKPTSEHEERLMRILSAKKFLFGRCSFLRGLVSHFRTRSAGQATAAVVCAREIQ